MIENLIQQVEDFRYALSESRKQTIKLQDKLHGTPCEEIRRSQVVEVMNRQINTLKKRIERQKKFIDQEHQKLEKTKEQLSNMIKQYESEKHYKEANIDFICCIANALKLDFDHGLIIEKIERLMENQK